MKVGAVILNYNSWKMSADLAKKLAAFSIVDEVIVVDNASTDDSFVNLQPLMCAKITVINSGKNGGYSYGNNYGAKILIQHKCDYLIFANPDVDIEEKSIVEIINALVYNEDFSMLSGIEYDINDNISKDPIWRRNRYIDDLKDCFYLGRKLKRKTIIVDYSCIIQPVEIVKGSFFVVKSVDFADINGFDENVFLFCEERILSRKMSNADKKIGVVTGAKYNHNHSASINNAYKSVTNQVKILYKSRYYYNCKYNQINKFQKIILRLSMTFSILEYHLIDIVRKK